MSFLEGKEILITGGTGSLGNALIRKILSEHKPKGIRIYSRDEFKQWNMHFELIKEFPTAPVSYLVGDVRDKERLSRAMNGVDFVINAAAMKQVPACEYNPIEAVRTNITGAENIINCAIDNNVQKVLHISTDKAVYPINLYGATKAVAEKLFIHANVYSPGRTLFSCCRYGNVLGSRGSIIPLLEKQIKENHKVTLTHPDMTRFFIHLPKVAEFILNRLNEMKGQEIFIPRMPSIKIKNLIKAVTTGNHTYTDVDVIGIRQGEKLHETLMTFEESEFAIVNDYGIVIQQESQFKSLAERWTYTSEITDFVIDDPKYIWHFIKTGEI